MHELKGLVGHARGFSTLLGRSPSSRKELIEDLGRELEELEYLLELTAYLEDGVVPRLFRIRAERFFKFYACVLRQSFLEKSQGFGFEYRVDKDHGLEIDVELLRPLVELIRLEPEPQGPGYLKVSREDAFFTVQIQGFSSKAPEGFFDTETGWTTRF